jgi:ATP synthase protein I
MQSLSGHSGDLSQDSVKADLHQSRVMTKAIDPAARTAKGAYRNLSSASVGLEMGISVIIGVLIGIWLDKQLGTTPWMMLLWLAFGFAAGFRGVLRAVKREDRNG